MGRLFRAFRVVILCLTTIAAVANDANPIPPLIRFSGTLHNTLGEPLSGTVGVTFALYKDENGGAPLWLEIQNVSPDAAGRYSVLLGSEHAHGLPPELFATGEPRWLGVTPEGLSESPRVLFAAVPYAMKSADAETLGGRPASAFLLAPTMPPALNSNAVRGNDVVNASTAISSDNGYGGAIAKYTSPSTLGPSIVTDTGSSLGIRLAAPEQVLDVLGRAQYRAEGQNTAGFFLRGTDALPEVFIGQVGSWSADSVGIWHGGAWRFIVAQNGNVGVGTTPGFRLDVRGRIRLQSERDASAGIWFGNPIDTPVVFLGQTGISAADGAGLWHSGAWRLVVTSAGNVGIGTINPTAPLEVAGNIRISGNGALMFPDGTTMTSAGQIGPNSIPPSAIIGTAATLGSNTFNGNQNISGAISADSLSVSGTAQFTALQSATTNGTAPALLARNDSPTGTGYAIDAETASSGGRAIYARASAATGPTVAIQGRTDSDSGIAIEGLTYSSTGNTVAIHATNPSTAGTALFAETTARTGSTIGVKATTAGLAGSAGVYALSSAASTTGPTYGVRAEAASQYGTALFGFASSTTGATKALSAKVYSPQGIAGEFTNYSGGDIIVANNDTNRVFRVASNGDIWIDGIVHTGGADYAEMVAVTGSREAYSPGDVLVISSDTDRALVLADKSYATTVAGIFSTKPGVLGSQHSINDPATSSELPLAITGIVPCKASAENGPIHRGDLLVTSSTPGHAMKGTDRTRMLGAVVGKALSTLESGTGTIEVLVTLQ